MINWPAIIKYRGEDELTHISCESEWLGDADLHLFAYDEGDRLIDSSGQAFSLAHREGSWVTPTILNEVFQAEAVIELVRKHASSVGECCAAKVSFNSIQEAICAIAELGDN